jgi:isopenicillin N synthase-like dioxygenase
MAVCGSIPNIDIAPFLSSTSTETERQQVVDQVRDACTTYGFFQAIGHGIPLEEQKGMLDCSKRFFALSEEQRMQVHVKNSMGEAFRGWEPPFIQTHHNGLMPDTKEVQLSRLTRLQIIY